MFIKKILKLVFFVSISYFILTFIFNRIIIMTLNAIEPGLGSAIRELALLPIKIAWIFVSELFMN